VLLHHLTAALDTEFCCIKTRLHERHGEAAVVNESLLVKKLQQLLVTRLRDWSMTDMTQER